MSSFVALVFSLSIAYGDRGLALVISSICPGSVLSPLVEVKYRDDVLVR